MQLSDIIPANIYNDFYTPMAAGSYGILEAVIKLTNASPDNTNIAYHQQLKQCQLDFSLGSLKRLDKFLSSIRMQKPIQHIELADNPKLEALFLSLIGYVGEVYSRARGQAALWFRDDEIHFDLLHKCAIKNFEKFSYATDWYPDSGIPELERHILVLFSKDKKTLTPDNIGFFLPVKAVYENLISDKPLRTTYEFVTHYLEMLGDNVPDDDFIPTTPNVFVDVNLPKKLANLKPQQRYYLQIKKPHWMQSDNELFPQLQYLGECYREGKVVWGALVQANKQLIQSRNPHMPNGYPGEIVYDPTGRTNATELMAYAHKLYELKTKDSDNPELATHGQRLKNEREYVIGRPYPSSLTNLPLRISTVFFWRHHLPNGLLSQSFFPILIHDKYKGVATPLPSRFWKQQFIEYWLNCESQQSGSDQNLMPRITTNEKKNLPSWSMSRHVSTDELLSENLYPTLTELFPNHVHPTETLENSHISKQQHSIGIEELHSPESKTDRKILTDEEKLEQQIQQSIRNSETKKGRLADYIIWIGLILLILIIILPIFSILFTLLK